MAVYKDKDITKDGRQYFFRIKYKDIYGNVHDYGSAKFKKKSDAEREEALFKLKVANKEAYTSSITFDYAFNTFREENKEFVKKQTPLKWDYMYKYLDPIKNMKINDITLVTYKQLLLELNKEKLSIDYKNKILNLLKRIIKYSNKYYNTSTILLRYIEHFKNPNKIKKEMKFFTYEEYKQFDSIIDDFSYHIFFEILYYMGLRQGEATALTWNDINFDKNELRINKTLTTKIKGELYTISSPKTKNSNRVLPMSQKIVEDLKMLKNSVMKYEDYSSDWFVFGNTLPFRETTIQKRKNEYCKLANVKQIRIHDFRHSCASLLINQGANIALVSKYLGHSNISITLNTYTHLYKNELENIANVLDKL